MLGEGGKLAELNAVVTEGGRGPIINTGTVSVWMKKRREKALRPAWGGSTELRGDGAKGLLNRDFKRVATGSSISPFIDSHRGKS